MIERLDHLVLTVAGLERSLDFYVRGLGGRAETHDGKHSVHFGNQKINLHVRDGEPILPRAQAPLAGSADFCFITTRALNEVTAELHGRALSIELGPVERRGALGVMDSIYLRDPDGNLVEIARYR